MASHSLLLVWFQLRLMPVAEAVALAATAFASLLALGLRMRDTMIVPLGAAQLRRPAITKVRPADEAEVIAEFLKNEFYHPDFDQDRKEFAPIVLSPNLKDARENARRRQLLFRKRGGLWRELPRDTEWWQVHIESRALGRIRVFPRADWRRYGQRGFSLPQFAQRIRAALAQMPLDPFLSALTLLQRQLVGGGSGGSVLLIGIDEDKPLTILEGNHRMVATALMTAPELNNFHFFCGFSPRMYQCCWYRASLGNLLHYAGNLLKDIRQFRHSDVAKMMPQRRVTAHASADGVQPKISVPSAALTVSDDLQLKGEKVDAAR